jgi:hypothetical protein
MRFSLRNGEIFLQVGAWAGHDPNAKCRMADLIGHSIFNERYCWLLALRPEPISFLSVTIEQLPVKTLLSLNCQSDSKNTNNWRASAETRAVLFQVTATLRGTAFDCAKGIDCTVDLGHFWAALASLELGFHLLASRIIAQIRLTPCLPVSLSRSLRSVANFLDPIGQTRFEWKRDIGLVEVENPRSCCIHEKKIGHRSCIRHGRPDRVDIDSFHKICEDFSSNIELRNVTDSEWLFLDFQLIAFQNIIGQFS